MSLDREREYIQLRSTIAFDTDPSYVAPQGRERARPALDSEMKSDMPFSNPPHSPSSGPQAPGGSPTALRRSQSLRPDVPMTVVYHSKTPLQLADEELARTHDGDFGIKRDLGPRVVSMIAIAGTIGTGLFIGSGSALTLGGPVGGFIAYLIMGILVVGMIVSLGEMTCFAPNVGGFVEMGAKYVDPAFGFMMGVNYVLMSGLAVPSELSAIALLFQYWDNNTSHSALYITAFLILTGTMNVIGVRYYGEVEFIFSCIKLTTLVGLVIFGLIANLGGLPNHKFIGGYYWHNEPFNDKFMDVSPVGLSRFLGFWAVFTRAAFSYTGIETVSLLAGEAHNPRETMRIAMRTVYYRVVCIYVAIMLIVGLTVSQYSPELLDGLNSGDETGSMVASPFVVLCKQSGVKALPTIINAVVITSALSCSNEMLYACSRTLVALAKQGYITSLFRRTDKRGVPMIAVGGALCFSPLAYLSVAKGSNQAFLWLLNLASLGGLLTWICICICFLRFKKALEVQGLDRANLQFRSPFQPYTAWVCIAFFTPVLFFNGFKAFIGHFRPSEFVASYITLPIVAAAYLFWKYGKGSAMVPPGQVDLVSGPAAALIGSKYDTRGTVLNFR